MTVTYLIFYHLASNSQASFSIHTSILLRYRLSFLLRVYLIGVCNTGAGFYRGSDETVTIDWHDETHTYGFVAVTCVLIMSRLTLSIPWENLFGK